MCGSSTLTKSRSCSLGDERDDEIAELYLVAVNCEVFESFTWIFSDVLLILHKIKRRKGSVI